MDSCRQKVFPTNESGYQNAYRPKYRPSGAEPTRTMSEDCDDLQQDRQRSRTMLDTSCLTCDVSVAHSKNGPHLGACRSLDSHFTDVSSSEKYSRKSQTLTEEYWACAIPNSLPPRPDRTSPHWDPNKEYQDLLDYTYPLNPKYFINRDDENEAEAFLQDSGVDLDSYNASCEGKFGSFTTTYREKHKAKTNKYSHANNQHLPFAFSTPLLKRTGDRGLQNPPGSSNVTLCGGFSPYASKLDLAKVCTSSLSPSRYDVLNKFSEEESSGDCSGQFLPTSNVLPLHIDLDTDEEYLSLPPTLKELETLAHYLRDLSLTVGDKNQGSSAKSNTVSEDSPKDTEYLTDFYSYDESKLNRFSSLRDMLDGRISAEVLDDSECSSIKENKSLVQKIQRFCQHLDKLIEWLYSVAEVTENWTAPKPNVESIQIALSLYLKLRKDVAEQQVLADTVLKDGESLVRSLSLNFSVLKDTLSLISKQSGELERHTERLYASVLDAMDTITEESLARNGNLKRVSLAMESS
ncbi:centrosomal protein of 68 kDa [Hyla sarda]|uniref:centrosomal protein of 68 kDa n=1 Tax=Hyla sarda TaxID=327740 RepID=UPI0024C2D0FF|nr:centrosomal protein of 68 kDa [Hyla sarda]XP_056423918.1 centrosomal protein of 68 kDa [Hyla sarda]XP_056423919.1 centrosomal protein of 68 kDa [Hyla sarda]XP_056423921.1 centrosomal protein of 68 kDa [Hyla sarda]XP_056423922.1 centrosomal protein of 68 kDa [Hyla sarda]XP_056423923.1 centrosomal protein of 68 kDa [Hyla sarda]